MKKTQRLAPKQSMLLLSSLLPLFCFTQPEQAWLRTYNASGDFSTDRAAASMVSTSGNIYVIGTTGREEKGLDFTTIKYGNHGTMTWTKKYTGPDNGNDYATAIWVDGDENVYVTGYSAAGDNLVDFDYATIKYDKDGNTKWVRRWAGSYGDDRPSSIAVDAVGNVYVSGSTNGVFNNYDYATVKYDKDGKEQWVRTYDGPFADRDFARAIAVDAASNVYVTGGSLGNDGNFDYATIKYNTNGDELWVKRYNGPANNYDAATSIAIDPLSNVYVTGSSVGKLADDFTTIKYNMNGELQWLRRYNSSGDDFFAKVIKLDTAGNVYVAGESGGLTTVKYSSDGNQKWAASYIGPNGGEDSLRSLAVDRNGNVFITGAFGSDPELTIVTIKYNSAGKEKWARTVFGPYIPEREGSVNVGVSVDVDTSGNVFMTGTIENLMHARDIITIKYNAKGVQKWVRQVNGERDGNDEATAMAVDLQGNMYITGITDANDPHQDMVTIKYDKEGNKLWGKRVGFKGGSEMPVAITADAMGNVCIVANIRQGDQTALLTVKYHTDGSLQWIKRYDGHGIANVYNQAMAVAVDAAGNVIVLGFTTGDNTDAFAIIKYNADGVQQWEALYKGLGFNTNVPSAMVLDGMGNVYVTGMSANGSQNFDFATVKYNAAGIQQWASTYNGPANGFDKALSIVVDAAGYVYVTGTSAGYATIKYDAAGNQLWVTRSAEGSPQNVPAGLVVDGLGNVYVTGSIFPVPNVYPFAPEFGTIKYNSAGVQQWINLYNGKTDDPDDKTFGNVNGIALDKTGNIYVYGTESITNDFDLEIGKIYSNRNFITIKYNSSGNTSWTEKLKVASIISTSFLAIDNENNFYVAGTKLSRGTNNDFLAVKYTQPAEGSNADNIITKAGNNKRVNEHTDKAAAQGLAAVAFPNPFQQNFTLQWKGNKQPVSIMIIDAAGRLIDRKTNLAATGNMQAGSNYSAGVYHVQIKQGNEQVTLKLIKK
jgi:uncharacterized delta-60 repeat protein